MRKSVEASQVKDDTLSEWIVTNAWRVYQFCLEQKLEFG